MRVEGVLGGEAGWRGGGVWAAVLDGDEGWMGEEEMRGYVSGDAEMEDWLWSLTRRTQPRAKPAPTSVFVTDGVEGVGEEVY